MVACVRMMMMMLTWMKVGPRWPLDWQELGLLVTTAATRSPLTVGSPGLWCRENLAPQRVRLVRHRARRMIAACDALTSVSDASYQELARAHHEN